MFVINYDIPSGYFIVSDTTGKVFNDMNGRFTSAAKCKFYDEALLLVRRRRVDALEKINDLPKPKMIKYLKASDIQM